MAKPPRANDSPRLTTESLLRNVHAKRNKKPRDCEAVMICYPTTGPDVLVAVESGAAAASAWSCLSLTCTSASTLSASAFAAAAASCAFFGVSFEPVTDFDPATSDEQECTGSSGEVQQ
jgi:hypothetical protein